MTDDADPRGRTAHINEIGGRIRRFRRDRQMSLTQLSEEAGVSKGYLSALENADNPVHASRRPSAETLYAIAKALGVTMSDLLGRKLLISPPTERSQSLQDFAAEAGLPEADIAMLSAIQFRGEAPKTIQRWRYIYDAIRMSETMDKTK